jgi:hypothetical protein
MIQIDLTDPIAVLVATFQALERAGIRAAVCGGLALAVYGEPRETKDADLAVAGTGIAEAESALSAAGLNVIRGFDRMRFGGLLVSRLTLFGGLGGSLNVADLIEPRSERYAATVLERATAGPLREQKIYVVSPEDFVVLKVLSSRERDLTDAASVLQSFGDKVDGALIESEIEQLAVEIPDHDVLPRWQSSKQSAELISNNLPKH